MNQIRHTSLPKNLELERRFDHLLIKRKWFRMNSVAVILFTIGWDYFLIDMLISFNHAASTDNDGIDIIVILSPIGFGLTYFSLAILFNKTHIFIDRKQLKIIHMPLPWFGLRQVAAKIYSNSLYLKIPGNTIQKATISLKPMTYAQSQSKVKISVFYQM